MFGRNERWLDAAQGKEQLAAGAFSPVAGSSSCGPLLPSHDDVAAIDAPVGCDHPHGPRQSPPWLEHHNLKHQHGLPHVICLRRRRIESTMSIRPLPDEVVAQIKSSTAIVSLIEVVLELLKNSLDAKASKIDVTVDFTRGGCTVEDDGLGIPPAEFAEDGRLGKLYCRSFVIPTQYMLTTTGTSKYMSDEPYLGQHGTFLASLSAMSLLTITSHHHAYRSHNSMTFHHSQTLERQTPTTAPHHIHSRHGTRVTVRNLFGNMPVRVKQRSTVMDQGLKRHRLCEALKKESVGLILGWQGGISLKIRDEDGKTLVTLNTLKTSAGENSQSTSVQRPPSPHLASLLNVITQAHYISIDDWSSWVPTYASTASLSVKGAISLEPSPTKHVQFISFGSRALSSEKGHNTLYDQVNSLFASSCFGTIEDDARVDEHEILRRQSDRRYKSDEYSNRQHKGRKGVERYPRFQLRISLKAGRASDLLEDRFIEDEVNLRAVSDILGAMITQWLTVHHFCPRKLHQVPLQPRTRPTTPRDLDERGSSPYCDHGSKLSAPVMSSAATLKPRPTTDIARETSSTVAPLQMLSGNQQSRPFAGWSRIKSGKSSFFDMNAATNKVQTYPVPSSTNESSRRQHVEVETQHAKFNIPPISKGALAPGATTLLQPKDDDASVPRYTDASVSWTDPLTLKTFLLNARTGSMMPPGDLRRGTDSLGSVNTVDETCTRKSLRVASNTSTADASKTPWLDDVLQTWNNPVFKPSEKGIPGLSLQDELEQAEQLHSNHSHTGCSHLDTSKMFGKPGSISARLSKEGLRNAVVISQVDQKFILIQMRGTSTASQTLPAAEVLVLVDQHAADERIHVEKLLAELCSPVRADVQKGYRSRLGLNSSVNFVILDKPLQFAISPQEYEHFKSYAASFAAWGILYDLDGSASEACTGETDTLKMTITTLPPSISERCKANVQVLVSLLRSILWQYVESPPLQPAALKKQHTSWVTQIATCPQRLVDMINSRACRSAIMFNDELSQGECSTLVSNLADCIFPFMCAHGRPSMIPIVDLERWHPHPSRQDTECLATDEINQRETFVDAWKKWRK